jgi:hypothetical protein
MADPYIRQMAREALAQTARNPTRDFLQATPRNSILGFLSDLAASSYSPERTQQMQGVAQFMGAPAISQTLDRLSYGEPLTTGAGGIGGTTRIRPEALEAAMTLAPMVAPTAQFTKGLPVGMSIKSVDDLVTKYPNVKAEKFINPSSIKPLNKVEDRKKYNEILESMKQEGWQGRPILAYEENGKTKALTGSHRIYAARKAGIDVPVVFVKPSVMKWEDNKGLFGTFKESINDQRVYEHLKAAGDDAAASLAKLEDVMGESYLQRQGLMPSIVPKVDETFAGFATPEQYSAAKFQSSMNAERWPEAWQRTGAVTPEEILQKKGITQPPPTQRDKDLYLLESRFSGYMDASKARQFLENDMLKATKKEKDLLRRYYDASGRFIAREEAPVQQAMQEFEQGLTNFMATR